MASDQLLLVEGIDDLHTLRNLVYRHNVLVHYDEDDTDPEACLFEIRQEGGRGNFNSTLDDFLRLGKIQTLGVVIDADEDPEASWHSVYRRFVQFEKDRRIPTLDEVDASEGWVGKTSNRLGDPIRVGIWVMPDNQNTGALEDFASTLIPDGDALWLYAESVLDELPEKRFRNVDVGKARMHTWLAWQNPPREPMGRAVSAGIFAHDSSLALRFVDWVNQLFDVDAEA